MSVSYTHLDVYKRQHPHYPQLNKTQSEAILVVAMKLIIRNLVIEIRVAMSVRYLMLLKCT